MSPNDIQHFLVIYDAARGPATVEEFGKDYAAALAAYTAREHEHRDRAEVDIVLLGSDSLETIKKNALELLRACRRVRALFRARGLLAAASNERAGLPGTGESSTAFNGVEVGRGRGYRRAGRHGLGCPRRTHNPEGRS